MTTYLNQRANEMFHTITSELFGAMKDTGMTQAGDDDPGLAAEVLKSLGVIRKGKVEPGAAATGKLLS